MIRGPWDQRPHQNPDDKPLVYLAGPYSIDVQAHNIHRGIKIADKVWATGLMFPFLPHLNGLWDIVTPRPVTDWYVLDRAFLRRCHALYRYDAGRESAGADAEAVDAADHGIPVWWDFESLVIWAKGWTGG